MARLLSRSKHPPFGYQILLPELAMKFPVKGSFNEVCIAFSRLIKANPGPAAKSGWPHPDDHDAVADWVDGHNAARLIALGYTSFVDNEAYGGDVFYDAAYHEAQKKTSLASVAVRVNAGAALWLELFGAEGRTVSQDVANARASKCIQCPKNDTTTSLFNIFVAAVARALGGLFEIMKDKELSTPHDAQLGVCSACLCPNRAKVHVPIERVLTHTDEPTMAKFNKENPRCWVLVEDNSSFPREGMTISNPQTANA